MAVGVRVWQVVLVWLTAPLRSRLGFLLLCWSLPWLRRGARLWIRRREFGLVGRMWLIPWQLGGIGLVPWDRHRAIVGRLGAGAFR